MCHTGLLTACEQDQDGIAVYSEKLLMMDRGTVRNMWSFIAKKNFENLGPLVGFVIRMKDRSASFDESIAQIA